ncbi:MAG: hypothetical protein KGJ86_22400, partial [Chloroflexota bacterium]|nr:hypothetical protein [Chloroflexota bacterium]
MAGILIVAELDQGQLRPETWELAGLARTLSPLVPGAVRLALLGPALETASEQASRLGAQELHLLGDERLSQPWPELHSEAVMQLCRRLEPEIALLPRTALGSEVATRVALRLGCALVQDAIHVELGPEGLT